MRDPVLEPIKIGTLQVKNRIFMPAMHMNMCQNFEVTDRLVHFYKRRAEGGAGLISVGYATVDEYSGNVGNIGAHSDTFLPGLADLALAIKSGGSKSVIQLNHAGRYNHSFFLGGKKPIAPSAVASRLTRETPREIEPHEITKVQERFAEAAVRAKKAGFDMVEILAGTGYLISEFLSPITNQRKDRYGGSLENRMRFGVEIIEKVREYIDDFPLLVRINGNDFMQGGIGRQEQQLFAEAMVEAGGDGLCINVGWHEAQVPQIATKVPRGVFGYLARGIRERVNVPVIASHRINDAQIARKLIGNGYCDMVAMGRALIADPDLPIKMEQGREETILHCVACGQGCFDNLIKMKGVECLCNPQAGYEFKGMLEQTSRPQKVLIAGGGPAGINSALAASQKGHDVTLYEKKMYLGGQLHLAGSPPGRSEFLVLANDLSKQIGLQDVKVVMGSEVNGITLMNERPDFLVVATGGVPIRPKIDGIDGENVIQAWDVLSGAYVPGGKIVVLGGGTVGVETAIYLAEQGTLTGEELKFLLVNEAEDLEELRLLATKGSRQISIIELSDKLGSNFGKTTKWGMMQDLHRLGVASYLQTKVERIVENGVIIGSDGNEQLIEADCVVLAVGTQPQAALVNVAAELGIATKVVGDAAMVGTVLDATHQGFRAGCSIA